MVWLLLQCLGLALSFLIVALSQSLDHVSSGRYQIRNCDAGRTGSMAADLQALLPQIYDNIQAVITDVKLGTASRHGYAAFFHNNNNIDYVQDIFMKIAAGSLVPLHNAEGRTTNPILNMGLPTIVCIRPGDPAVSGLYEGCKDLSNIAGHKDNFILLCPSFWEFDDEPESFDCPRLRKNTLTPNDETLANNKQATLVHELAHLYGVTSGLRWQDGHFEAYKVRDATDLDEKDALKNAPNFAYYYAGR